MVLNKERDYGIVVRKTLLTASKLVPTHLPVRTDFSCRTACPMGL